MEHRGASCHTRKWVSHVTHVNVMSHTWTLYPSVNDVFIRDISVFIEFVRDVTHIRLVKYACSWNSCVTYACSWSSCVTWLIYDMSHVIYDTTHDAVPVFNDVSICDVFICDMSALIKLVRAVTHSFVRDVTHRWLVTMTPHMTSLTSFHDVFICLFWHVSSEKIYQKRGILKLNWMRRVERDTWMCEIKITLFWQVFCTFTALFWHVSSTKINLCLNIFSTFTALFWHVFSTYISFFWHV